MKCVLNIYELSITSERYRAYDVLVHHKTQFGT